MQSGESDFNLPPSSGGTGAKAAAGVLSARSQETAATPKETTPREAFHLTPQNWPGSTTRVDVSSRPHAVNLPFNGHAAPLMPIRSRDVEAMSELFDIQDIAEIECDINHNLTRRYPEPSWDDEVFSFLSHFL